MHFDRFTELKVCPKCGKEKHMSQFFKNKQLKDGLSCYCKKCSNKLAVNYHKEKLKIIKVPIETRDAFKAIAERHGMSMPELMDNIIKKINKDDGVEED